ncbi:HNH endonuclease [Modestobacter marinus]|uniref:HNH endonuclease n=1 Tax=Modestobacter marinus TaxID=477641 RepID=UPI001C973637|nr:HNH endonuclease [Modestobacter marinus]
MPQPDATTEDVLAAIREFDQLGRESFLQKFGFGRARDYFVRHGGRFYDSKALLGVAHGYQHGEPLRPDEFSGGDAAAAATLRGLGFTVSDPNPDWTEDEIVLACDLISRHGWRYLDENHPEVEELSQVLQLLSRHPEARRGPTFRNPSGVARKTADIATQHPDSTGRPTRGNRLDKVVLDQFLADPAGMAGRARAIRAAIDNPDATAPLPDLDLDPDASADEGGILERKSLVRERDPKLRRHKIKSVLKSGGTVSCEVCAFDFERTYGERGRLYIEVHHRTPLHVTGTVRTRLADLALLCSNCHRMIHRRRPWLSIEDLQDALQQP